MGFWGIESPIPAVGALRRRGTVRRYLLAAVCLLMVSGTVLANRLVAL